MTNLRQGREAVGLYQSKAVVWTSVTPQTTNGCDIALFIHLLLCPYFLPEESEKSKISGLAPIFFMLVKLYYFIGGFGFCSSKE